MDYRFGALLLALVGEAVWGAGPESVTLDLRRGMVRGYSQYISFVVLPSPSTTQACDAQAVVRIDFSGPYSRARLHLKYATPRLWTLDVSDSPYGDGYGGDNGTTSNMAELQIFNRQMRIYGNSLPDYLDATIDGGLLLKVVDDIVKKNRRMSIEVSDERVEWKVKKAREFIESKFLYTLSGQNTTRGPIDQYVYAGFNRVVAGQFRAGTGLCVARITLLPDDSLSVNKCAKKKNGCDEHAYCENVRRTYRCHCNPGFYGNGKLCEEDDECEYENGGCVHECANSPGSYSCRCLHGFKLAPDRHSCVDENECLTARGGCEHQCINTLGSYECRCNAGYSLQADGKTCAVGTWCTSQFGCSHFCEYSRRTGRPYCSCRHGYRLHSNGKDCTPTCSVGNGGCHHHCNDTRPDRPPTCSCHSKYNTSASDPHLCVPTCMVRNGGCDKVCRDRAGVGPECACPSGFRLQQLDGRTCLDVDECGTANGGCSHSCINTHGSFECVCPRGYRVQDDRQCQDIDECAVADHCEHTCTNHPGGFQCTCRPGFQLYGLVHCADKNECVENNGGCEHVCTNTNGSFYCSCTDKYHLHGNKRDCVAMAAGCTVLLPPAMTTMTCSQLRGRKECTFSCRGKAHFTMTTSSVHKVFCDASTNFSWSHELSNATLPTCSEQVTAPGCRRHVRFSFLTPQCKVRQRGVRDLQSQLVPLLVDERCDAGCAVKALKLKCKRGRLRRGAKTRMTAAFVLQVAPQNVTDSCNVTCARRLGRRLLKRATKKLRRLIKEKKLSLKYDGDRYNVINQSLKAKRITTDICTRGHVLVSEQCVSCSVGSSHDNQTDSCVPCAAGSYQNRESQSECRTCSHGLPGVGLESATSENDCTVQCQPGSHSDTGLRPCRLCARGTYQPHYGRTQCLPCGSDVSTRHAGATSFQQCLVAEHCAEGHYFSRPGGRCVRCPRDQYQSERGQDYCRDCPGDTRTDHPGATSSAQCKDRRCGGVVDARAERGYLQSPNWPGSYPANMDCTWKIKPRENRRILVVIPEISLAAQDKCGDKLVMRRSRSPYSVTTYETCESTDTPIAFTARTTSLWISFVTNGNNSAQGFSIPYVTYHEEYQDLIDDIVRDGRLYGSYQHQEVLKNRTLLSAMLEVIESPYNYFKYYNVSSSMFPASFIRLLRHKVLRFFDYS